MDAFDKLYAQIFPIVGELQDIYKAVWTVKEQLKEQNEELTKLYNDEAIAHDKCQEELEATKKTVEKLKAQIAVLEEDRAQFAKVSHIIALEKDNAKLKAELEVHRAKLAEVERKPQHRPEQLPVTTVVDKPEPELRPTEETEDTEDTNFYEKKIKGIRYFIGEETQTIYAIAIDDDGDETVGDAVGKLEKDTATGKTKVKMM